MSTPYTYSRLPAFNNNTSPASVAKSATGSIYDINDVGFLTPLNLTLVVGNTTTITLSSDSNGMFPDFIVQDRTQVVFKSGTISFVLTTTTPIKGDQGPAGIVPAWAPNTPYTAGQLVISPNNDIVSAISGFVSGASYDPTKWALSSTYATPQKAAGKGAAMAIVFGG